MNNLFVEIIKTSYNKVFYISDDAIEMVPGIIMASNEVVRDYQHPFLNAVSEHSLWHYNIVKV